MALARDCLFVSMIALAKRWGSGRRLYECDVFVWCCFAGILGEGCGIGASFTLGSGTWIVFICDAWIACDRIGMDCWFDDAVAVLDREAARSWSEAICLSPKCLSVVGFVSVSVNDLVAMIAASWTVTWGGEALWGKMCIVSVILSEFVREQYTLWHR